ncbi:MAG: hypothetical protein B6U94_00200 [Thermofilum sp. ex4484_79]|nr:MAG: hypothetical protein B6U94_00200 [Thermofilum sp. ex4484_79]
MKKLTTIVLLFFIVISFLLLSNDVLGIPQEVEEIYLWRRLTIANNGTKSYKMEEPIVLNLAINNSFQEAYLENVTVYLNNEKIEGTRFRIENDSCNNSALLIYYFSEIPPRSCLSIEILQFVRIHRFHIPRDVSFNNSGKLSNIPFKLKKRYTKAEGVWIYNDKGMRYLADKARELVGNETNVLKIVSQLVDYIWAKVVYSLFIDLGILMRLYLLKRSMRV